MLESIVPFLSDKHAITLILKVKIKEKYEVHRTFTSLTAHSSLLNDQSTVLGKYRTLLSLTCHFLVLWGGKADSDESSYLSSVSFLCHKGRVQ